MNLGHVFVAALAVIVVGVALYRRLSLRSAFNFKNIVMLDAESLAEQGIGEAYKKLLPMLREYVAKPAELEEIVDEALPSYAIRCNGQEHVVYSANEPNSERDSWGRAAYFFFSVVNSQLAATGVRFYALYGGNDLGGIFLQPQQVKEAQVALPRKSDWPYIPELSGPWWGQPH